MWGCRGKQGVGSGGVSWTGGRAWGELGRGVRENRVSGLGASGCGDGGEGAPEERALGAGGGRGWGRLRVLRGQEGTPHAVLSLPARGASLRPRRVWRDVQEALEGLRHRGHPGAHTHPGAGGTARVPAACGGQRWPCLVSEGHKQQSQITE